MKFVTFQVMQETNTGTDIRKELRDITLGPMSDKTYEVVMRSAVENGIITKEQYAESTGKAYA